MFKTCFQKRFFSILFGFVFSSCLGEAKEPQIIIEKETDTISVGSIFEARLFLENKDSTWIADFFIIQNNDTFLLDFNPRDRFAIFKATTYSSGKKQYFGFAQFENEIGEIKRKDFTIEFLSEEK